MRQCPNAWNKSQIILRQFHQNRNQRIRPQNVSLTFSIDAEIYFAVFFVTTVRDSNYCYSVTAVGRSVTAVGRFQPVTPLKFMLIERQLYAQEQPVM
jgi:hypothetical protein